MSRVMIETEVGHKIDRIEAGETIEVQVMVGLVQGQEQVQIDRIRCFECREYDILQGSVLLEEKIGRQNKCNRCLA